jgi:hypothetical protein
MLKHVLIDMWANDQNEMMLSTSNHKILYLTMLIVCRKNLSQSDVTDCKIIAIEGEEKVFWWGALIIVNVLKFNRN